MQCTKPIRLTIKNKYGHINPSYPDGLDVPCGKCIACRMMKRKEWTIRMLHENEYHESSCFTTLTYDDDHLPPNMSLVKKDFQLFMKRLRKSLSLAHKPKIRYFACGEYGDQTQRPHYHAILFGLGLLPDDQKHINDNWPYGFVKSGSVTPDSIRYVAQYIDKKFSGDMAETEYQQKNREPVFRLSSLGLGKQFCDDWSDDLKRNLFVTINGVKHSIPRYYLKRMGVDLNSVITEAQYSEMETVEHYTGIYISNDDMYKHGNASDVRSLVDGVKSARNQHDKNLRARVNLRRSKI